MSDSLGQPETELRVPVIYGGRTLRRKGVSEEVRTGAGAEQ